MTIKFVFFRQRGNDLIKSNPHHRYDGRFTFGIGERVGLFDKPAIRVIQARNQVRPSERLSEAGSRAKRELLAVFAEVGGAIKNRDSRHPIMVTAKSASHLVHLEPKHQPLKQHIEAAFCLPDLVLHAVLAERHRDRKDGQQDLFVARYYAPFSCDGVLYRVKLTVFELRGADRQFKLYDHALSEIELVPLQKISPARGGALREAGSQDGERDLSASTVAVGDPLRSPVSKITVGRMLEGVNRDSDGLPFGTPTR